MPMGAPCVSIQSRSWLSARMSATSSVPNAPCVKTSFSRRHRAFASRSSATQRGLSGP